MDFRIWDFVNRDEALATLWKIIRHEIDQRVALVRGLEYIGKTYLLAEFQEECRAEGIASVSVDLEERAGQSYLTIVESVGNQLSWEGFEPLIRTFEEVRTYSPSKDISSSLVADQVTVANRQVARGGERSGGIDIHGSAEIRRDAVGRDVNYIAQFFLYEDPLVQERIRIEVTDAFQKCLTEVTARRQVVFLFDTWNKANLDTSNWLCDTLLNWILQGKLSDAVAVVFSREVPDSHKMFRIIKPLILTDLPDEAIRTYWVEKYGLPPEKIPEKNYAGLPGLLAMMAQRGKTGRHLDVE